MAPQSKRTYYLTAEQTGLLFDFAGLLKLLQPSIVFHMEIGNFIRSTTSNDWFLYELQYWAEMS